MKFKFLNKIYLIIFVNKKLLFNKRIKTLMEEGL